MGLERWQHDVWHRILTAALAGHPAQVETRDLPGFNRPAVSRYGATTPSLLRWFKTFNHGKSYRQQVRPFGFLLAFQASHAANSGASDRPLTAKPHVADQPPPSAKPVKPSLPKVVAPYDTNLLRAARHSFDRETGKPVSPRQLKSYRQSLLRYHLHPEAKFLGGAYVDAGITRRRHIQASGIHLIGKEANRWEEQFFLGLDPDAQNEYGIANADRTQKLETIRKAAEACGMTTFAAAIKWSRRHLCDILAGRKSPPDAELARLAAKAGQLLAESHAAADHIMPLVRQRCQDIGLRRFASQARMAHGHLSLILSDQRKPTRQVLSRLQQAVEQDNAARPVIPHTAHDKPSPRHQ